MLTFIFAEVWTKLKSFLFLSLHMRTCWRARRKKINSITSVLRFIGQRWWNRRDNSYKNVAILTTPKFGCILMSRIGKDRVLKNCAWDRKTPAQKPWVQLLNVTREKNTQIHLYSMLTTRSQEKVWQIGFGISVMSGGRVAGENKYRLCPAAKSGRGKKSGSRNWRCHQCWRHL